MASGKLEAEVGLFTTVKTWVTLRLWFTESELRFFGWNKVPMMALEPNDLWKSDLEAPKYYTVRKLDLPSEVKAVINLTNRVG